MIVSNYSLELRCDICADVVAVYYGRDESEVLAKARLAGWLLRIPEGTCKCRLCRSVTLAAD